MSFSFVQALLVAAEIQCTRVHELFDPAFLVKITRAGLVRCNGRERAVSGQQAVPRRRAEVRGPLCVRDFLGNVCPVEPGLQQGAQRVRQVIIAFVDVVDCRAGDVSATPARLSAFQACLGGFLQRVSRE